MYYAHIGTVLEIKLINIAMKKISTVLLLLVLCVFYADAQAVIGGKTYKVDTLMHRKIGPGIMHTRLRLPDYPLNVYLLEVDVTNRYNRVETTQAKNLLGSTEKLADAYARHKSYGKKPIAACNASFWCVSSQIPWYNFMPGVPHGAEVVNDTIYVNTNRNGVFDFNGGTVNTASTIIDKAGMVHVGRHEWYGCVKSPKFSADQEIIQVNKCCDTGQLVLFNHARGRNHKFFTYPNDCDYVFLKFKDGESWKIAKDMKFEVAKIEPKANNQVLGNYDACLIADGAYKDEMAKLAVGDEVAINTYWFDIDGDRKPIEVENMTEGEAHVMLKGEITNRATADYGAMVYSRTAYGCNKEGTKLYMLVIDKSTHPEYGTSAGCTATVMCQLWKSLVPDLWNVANMDAGGSAQMLVDGSVINYTTEGTPRAVANGMMLFSTAPEEDRDVIAELRFKETKHIVPTYSSYAPEVLGYNKYGELISEDVPVTYTCSENVGESSVDGFAINAGYKAATGTITAHYNGALVTAPIEVLQSEVGIRIKPYILIDNKHEYRLEVSSVYNGIEEICDPLLFTWSVEDETVASIENGILKGHKNGETTIKVVLGDFNDETKVKVEIPYKEEMYQTWDGWAVSGSKLTSGSAPALSTDGVVSFDYSGAADANVTLTKDVLFYGLPDSLWLEFTSTTVLQSVKIDIRSNLNYDSNEIVEYKFPTKGSLKANVKHKLDILSVLGDKNDISRYPIIIKSIAFCPRRAGYNSGTNTIRISGLCAKYDSATSGVADVPGDKSRIKVFPNPVTDGVFMISIPGEGCVNVAIYNTTGSLLFNKTLESKGENLTVNSGLSSGIYYVKATWNGTESINTIIIK